MAQIALQTLSGVIVDWKMQALNHFDLHFHYLRVYNTNTSSNVKMKKARNANQVCYGIFSFNAQNCVLYQTMCPDYPI